MTFEKIYLTYSRRNFYNDSQILKLGILVEFRALIQGEITKGQVLGK